MSKFAWVLTLGFIFMSGAAWAVRYERSDLGYTLDFPGTPVEANGVYRARTVEGAPTHIATARTDTGIFIATVVDLFERAEDGASLMSEAEFYLRLLGDVVDVSTARTPPGENAVFGRHITIDMRSDRTSEIVGQTETAHKMFNDAAGLEVIDGARMITQMYFREGRFFIFQGINLPIDGDALRPEALLFILSFAWAGEAGDPALDEYLPSGDPPQ